MPRPRKSVEQHVLEGTYRADRHGPKPSASQMSRRLLQTPPKRPKDLTPAERAKWDATVPLLSDRLIGVDVALLTELVRWMVRADDVAAVLRKTPVVDKGYRSLAVTAAIATDKIAVLSTRLGLSPADRVKLGPAPSPVRSKIPTAPRVFPGDAELLDEEAAKERKFFGDEQ